MKRFIVMVACVAPIFAEDVVPKVTIINNTPVGVKINGATCLGNKGTLTLNARPGSTVSIEVYRDPYDQRQGKLCTGDVIAREDGVSLDNKEILDITRPEGRIYLLNGKKMAGQDAKQDVDVKKVDNVQQGIDSSSFFVSACPADKPYMSGVTCAAGAACAAGIACVANCPAGQGTRDVGDGKKLCVPCGPASVAQDNTCLPK